MRYFVTTSDIAWQKCAIHQHLRLHMRYKISRYFYSVHTCASNYVAKKCFFFCKSLSCLIPWFFCSLSANKYDNHLVCLISFWYSIANSGIFVISYCKISRSLINHCFLWIDLKEITDRILQNFNRSFNWVKIFAHTLISENIYL